jgi:hypothetical protein
MEVSLGVEQDALGTRADPARLDAVRPRVLAALVAKTRNLPLAIAAGVLSVSLLRQIL